MCGIAGWQLTPGAEMDSSVIVEMAEALNHRGPDDRGYFTSPDGRVAFAHTRLSIIDPSPAGHQPMASADGGRVLNYNGELFNFRRLRSELDAEGAPFRSRCDTEVVLRALEHWGEGAIPRFDGMFAFALWSEESPDLLLARDPMGIKPLYYTAIPGEKGLAFASEIKAFLRLPGFIARMSDLALSQYLEFGYTFDVHQTSLEDVYKLPPGHTMTLQEGRAGEPVRYFRPSLDPAPAGEDVVARLHDTLTEVVREQLVADVPVALLLSGGIDSSLLAALAAREGPLTTVCMGFTDSGVDERPAARRVSDFIGSEHVEIAIDPEDVVAELADDAWFFDDLFGDWGTVTTRILYRRCREMGIKVVLVGEGSDELFGGYSIFDYRPWGPEFLRAFQLYRRYAGRRYGRQFPAFYRAIHGHLEEGEGDWFQAVRLFETRNQLPNNYVMKVDKASMSESVEARVPFLDRRVAEIAYSLPSSALLDGDSNKLPLRQVAERYRLLPPETTWQPKFGGSLAASWMDDSPAFRAFAERVIMGPGGWVDRLGLRRAMRSYFSGRRSGYPFPHPVGVFRNVAWRLLLLNLWSTRFLSRVG